MFHRKKLCKSSAEPWNYCILFYILNIPIAVTCYGLLSESCWHGRCVCQRDVVSFGVWWSRIHELQQSAEHLFTIYCYGNLRRRKHSTAFANGEVRFVAVECLQFKKECNTSRSRWYIVPTSISGQYIFSLVRFWIIETRSWSVIVISNLVFASLWYSK